MLNKEVKICKIITFNEEDLLSFSLEFSASGVDVVLEDLKNKLEIKENTIIVGWSNVKKLFPTQRISQKKIHDNVFWVYSQNEEKKLSLSETQKHVKFFLKNWLPDIYMPYDIILDGKLSKFLENHFEKPFKLFAYFSGKALFLYNKQDSKKIIGISLESIKYAGSDVKKVIAAIIENYSPICFSYNNISPYITENCKLSLCTIENLFWARYNEEISEKNFHDFLMDNESDRYIPFLMCELYTKQTISAEENVYINRLTRKDIITEWLSKREVFFDKNYSNDKLNFKKSSNNMNFLRLQYSDKRTITGRINCIDRTFNPQKLERDGDDRKVIISRFKNGKIAVLDYVSFETKIALYLCGDDEFIEKFKNKDLHEETAKVIFQKDNLTPEERLIGKSINHTLIYGGGKEILKKNLGDLENADETLERVKEFLSPIINKSEQIKNSLEEIGFIINSFGTIVRPKKIWASFQNYVQSISADILVEKLYEIKEYTNYSKSKFLFQVHDSFVFDLHPDEDNFLTDIQNILSNFNNIKLQVKIAVGNNFSEASN